MRRCRLPTPVRPRSSPGCRPSWSKPYQGYAESTGALALPTTDQLDRPQHAAERPDPDARVVAVRDRLALRHDHPGRGAQHPHDRRRFRRLGLRGQPGGRRRARRRRPRPAPAGDRHPAAAAGGPDAQRGDRRRARRPPGPPGRRPAGRGPRAAAERLAQQRGPGRRVGRRGVRDPCPRRGLRSVGRPPGHVEHLPRLLRRRTGTADTGFAAPPGARVRSVARPDFVRDIARFGGPRPPDTLLGFTRSTPGAGSRRSASTARASPSSS